MGARVPLPVLGETPSAPRPTIPECYGDVCITCSDEPFPDLGAREALADQRQDLLLPGGQLGLLGGDGALRPLGVGLDRPLRQWGAQVAAPLGDLPDAPDQLGGLGLLEDVGAGAVLEG